MTEAEVEEILESPPPALDHLVDELIQWKDDREEELEVEWVPEEGAFHVLRGAAGTVALFTAEIDGEFYLDGEAVVVEAEVGPVADVEDLADLLRYSYEEQVYSRLAVGEGDVLLVQAALPIGHLAPEQLDGMIREVASIAAELREEEPASEA